MKKICLFLVMAGILHQSLIAQEQDSTHATPTDLAAMHLKKSKNQKTLAWVMLGTGLGLVIIGGTTDIGVTEDTFMYSDEQVILTGIGVLTTLGSIPLFLASGKNKRKAALYLHPANTVLIPGQKVKLAPQLTLSVRL